MSAYDDWKLAYPPHWDDDDVEDPADRAERIRETRDDR